MKHTPLYLGFSSFMGFSLGACIIDPGQEGNDETSCQPGTEGCECIEGGLCVAGLACASNLCVDLAADESEDEGEMKPEDDGSADQGEGDTEGPVGSCVNNCGGFSPDGDGYCACGPQCEFNGDCCADYQAACSGDCLFNSDCAADEVCSTSTLDCVEAYWHEYDVYVDWEDHTPDCWDTFDDDCFADPLYTATYGGVEVYTSGYYTNVTSAYFAEPFTIVANPFDGLTVAFYDWDDITANDYMNSVCLSDGFSCAPIGVEYLHGGGATWDTTEDPDPQSRFYVHLTFVPR